MTPFYIAEYRKKLKRCNTCKTDRVKGRLFCERHLTEARVAFRLWSSERRRLGKCISCRKHSFSGFLRCRAHTFINRERCRVWVAENKAHITAYWAARKAQFLAQGQCCQCPAHKPVVPGKRRCVDCQMRSRVYRTRSIQRKAV